MYRDMCVPDNICELEIHTDISNFLIKERKYLLEKKQYQDFRQIIIKKKY